MKLFIGLGSIFLAVGDTEGLGYAILFSPMRDLD